MAVATQALREFKGDHISAKMFRPDGKPFSFMVPAFNCSMEAGSNILTVVFNDVFSASALTEASIGFDVIVHAPSATPRDGAPGFKPALTGALLKTRIVSVEDGTHAILADPAPVGFSGATVDIGPDDTQTLLDTLMTNGINGEGLSRLIPTGCYMARPGALLIPNPGSLVWSGQGNRFNSIIRSNDPDSGLPMVQLGDGVIDSPHHWVIEHLTISKGYGQGTALYLNVMQIGVVRDVVITDLGLNGIGIDTARHGTINEIILDRVSVYGGDGWGGTGLPNLKGAIGMRLYPSSNIVLLNCNIEDVPIGLYCEGQTQCTLTMIGGHHERSDIAVILRNVQPFIDHEITTGDIYLANDVVNGDIRISSNSTLWSNGSFVDCGFGNRIRRTSSTPLNGNLGVFSTAIAFDGDEWLKVPTAIDDPTFLRDITEHWTAGGGSTISTAPVAFPGCKGGRALAIEDGGGGNGYAERTVTVTEQTDYLLQVGLLTQKNQTYRIIVEDSGGTLWDSGTWNYTEIPNDFQSFKVFRKRIPTGTGITQLTIKLYAVAGNQITICPLLLLSESDIRMEGAMLSQGTGFSASGTGITYTVTQDVSTGLAYTFKLPPDPELAHYGRCFIRAVVNDSSADAAKTASIGVSSTAASPAGGPIVKLHQGTDVEYVIPVTFYPYQSTVLFYSFAGVSNTITIKEVGIYLIKDDATVMKRLRIEGRNVDTLDSDGNIRLPVTTSFASEDLRFISTAPLDGRVKKPHILALSNFGFDPNQGTIYCLNSKPTGYPDWQQTSRIYDFTADASSNTITITALGYFYESVSVPFTGESFVITETTASGLTVDVNYWLKVSSGLTYEVYSDQSMSTRVTLGDGSGKLTASPYATFIQLSTCTVGFGFGRATNANGVAPWHDDPYNTGSWADLPPLALISGRNSNAVKESHQKSGLYTGYPIFPQYNGFSGGIFHSSGDPAGQPLWDGSYPPISSICLWSDGLGRGRVSIRKGPAPATDDGSGWVDVSADELWSVVDANSIRTVYRVQITDPSNSRPVGIILTPTTHISQPATPLLSAAVFEVDYQGRAKAKSLSVGTGSAPTTEGHLYSQFVGINASGADSTEILNVNGRSRLNGFVGLPQLTADRPLKLSGTDVTAAKIDLSSSNDVQNSLPLANGGTGGSSASTARTALDVYSKAEVDALIAAKVNQSTYDTHRHHETGTDTGEPFNP